MIRKLFHFHGGVQPADYKAESTTLPIAPAPLPEQLVLPLSQHVGARAEALVAPGERVLKGQLLARAHAAVSATVHAPTSGTVRAIEPRVVPHPSGLTDLCIVLDADGHERWIDREPLDAASADPDAIRARIGAAGIVGLGGAVFPSHLKLKTATKLDTLILNGGECEPYITCDDMLMRERAADIVRGVAIIQRLLEAREILIGIELNKPQAIAAMREAIRKAGLSAEVVPVPHVYPGGGEKQLIATLTGIEVPAGKYPPQFGVACFNVGTAYAIYRAVELGEPLISRIVTLAGNVAAPRNVEALIGTPAGALLAHAGARADSDGAIMGGPMMGMRLPSSEAPVVKATNCLIATSRKLFPAPPPEMPCIRCGRCALACPAELQPFELYWYSRAKDVERAATYGLADCIECGACSYVCPSHIPLVHYYRYAKGELAEQHRALTQASDARARYEQHVERKTRDEGNTAIDSIAAREHQEMAAALDKQAVIQAALQRAKRRVSGPKD